MIDADEIQRTLDTATRYLEAGRHCCCASELGAAAAMLDAAGEYPEANGYARRMRTLWGKLWSSTDNPHVLQDIAERQRDETRGALR